MYVEQNFQDGQVLYAAQLTHMETALSSLADDIDTLNAWKQTHGVVETGTVTLTNAQEFPFNASKKSVALQNRQSNTDYIVLVDVVDFTGNVGDVDVVSKMVNGFSLQCSGGASSVTVDYVVIGGFSE